MSWLFLKGLTFSEAVQTNMLGGGCFWCMP
jgi:hypothetical protein